MILVATTDFNGGKYAIADSGGNYTIPNIQKYIDLYEKSAIYDLLGVTFAEEVIAYLAASRAPADGLLDKIIDPFFYQQDNSSPVFESKGIKDICLARILYEYITDDAVNSTQAGVVAIKTETADTSIGMAYRYAEKRWNESLDTVDTIQVYINRNLGDYPDFAGNRFKPKFSALL